MFAFLRMECSMVVRGLMGLKESPLSGEAKGLFTSKVWEYVSHRAKPHMSEPFMLMGSLRP